MAHEYSLFGSDLPLLGSIARSTIEVYGLTVVHHVQSSPWFKKEGIVKDHSDSLRFLPAHNEQASGLVIPCLQAELALPHQSVLKIDVEKLLLHVYLTPDRENDNHVVFSHPRNR